MTIRKRTAAGIAGLALTASSSFALAAQPQGLYSADQLMDAHVYMNGSNKEVGEIEDIVFDNNMRIKSFVIETENDFGLNGKSYVVTPNQLSVETMAGDKVTEPEYRVTLNADAQTLSGYPEYNDAWWTNAQGQAADAWEQTKDSASSAWTRVKKGTANLVDSTREAIHNATDDTSDAADEAADNTADAADDAADTTEDTAQDATN